MWIHYSCTEVYDATVTRCSCTEVYDATVTRCSCTEVYDATVTRYSCTEVYDATVTRYSCTEVYDATVTRCSCTEVYDATVARYSCTEVYDATVTRCSCTEVYDATVTRYSCTEVYDACGRNGGKEMHTDFWCRKKSKEKGHLGRPRRRWEKYNRVLLIACLGTLERECERRKILAVVEVILQKQHRGCGVDSTGSEKRRAVDCYDAKF